MQGLEDECPRSVLRDAFPSPPRALSSIADMASTAEPPPTHSRVYAAASSALPFLRLPSLNVHFPAFIVSMVKVRTVRPSPNGADR